MPITRRLLIALVAGIFFAGLFALGYLLKNPFWVVLPEDYDWQAGARHWLQLSEAGFLAGFLLVLSILPAGSSSNRSAG